MKLLHAITLENVADAVVKASLTSREEVDALISAVYAFAADRNTLAAAPRIVQVWARRPSWV